MHSTTIAEKKFSPPPKEERNELQDVFAKLHRKTVTEEVIETPSSELAEVPSESNLKSE